MAWATAAVVATAGATAYAALSPASQLFGRTLIAPRRPQQIALTYDDGPNPAATPYLLDVLGRADVRATFFLIGRFVREQPALTRTIAAAGHVIGNHTMTHPWLAWQTAARIREELTGCNAALEDTLGAPVRFFRPPHGARRPFVLSVVRELGLTTVQWNILGGDWIPTDPATLLARLERGMAKNRSAGCASNILLHDGSQIGLGAPRMPTVEATRRLLEQQTKISFVTIDAWSSPS